MELQERLGLTFVIVTHDQEEAMTVADRIAVMNRGRLAQVGHAGGDLRAAELALGRGLHRRRQPDRRRGSASYRPRPCRDRDAWPAAAARRAASAVARRARRCGSRCGRRRSQIAPRSRAGDARRRTASPGASPTSAISATSRSTRCELDNGLDAEGGGRRTARAWSRADRSDDRVWLSLGARRRRGADAMSAHGDEARTTSDATRLVDPRRRRCGSPCSSSCRS